MSFSYGRSIYRSKQDDKFDSHVFLFKEVNSLETHDIAKIYGESKFCLTQTLFNSDNSSGKSTHIHAHEPKQFRYVSKSKTTSFPT